MELSFTPDQEKAICRHPVPDWWAKIPCNRFAWNYINEQFINPKWYPKPCPLCGTPAECGTHKEDPKKFMVRCPKDGLMIEGDRDTVCKWNDRVEGKK